MGDYEYYEEPAPVPTFSDGSTSGGRGANSRAAASRAVASKSAVSAASRASAMMAASIQQLPKNSIITSNGIRSLQPVKPAVNKNVLQAAQKRAENIMKNVKPPEPMMIKLTPIEVVAKIPASTTILESAKTDVVAKNITKFQTVSSDEHMEIVKTARQKKEELLVSFQAPVKTSMPRYRPVKMIRHKTITDTPVNQDALQQLSDGLLLALRSSDKTAILDEFTKYQGSLRISIEQPSHKEAVQKSRDNKTVYFTSDA